MDRPEMIRGDLALAKFLGVSRTTVEKLNREGRLDSARYKVGRLNIYDRDKVLNILKY